MFRVNAQATSGAAVDRLSQKAVRHGAGRGAWPTGELKIRSSTSSTCMRWQALSSLFGFGFGVKHAGGYGKKHAPGHCFRKYQGSGQPAPHLAAAGDSKGGNGSARHGDGTTGERTPCSCSGIPVDLDIRRDGEHAPDCDDILQILLIASLASWLH